MLITGFLCILYYVLNYDVKLGCNAKVIPLINQGKEVKPNEFPYVGIIRNGDEICTGTLVTENLVLTAGHCLIDTPCRIYKPNELTFYIGDVTLQKKEFTSHYKRQVKEVGD